ncbi:MAG: transglycosylase domain-containing protein [Desulfatitalea sp.]
MSIRKFSKNRRVWVGMAIALPAILVALTIFGLSPSLPVSLDAAVLEGAIPVFADRYGQPLSRTYQSTLNPHDLVPYHDIPERLIAAFITAEDTRFFRHHGIDWLARMHALWQNMKGLEKVRGASTITEQVIRILQPRPRTYWSRWLEGWEAMRLERRFDKQEILEFYLNQVPFSSGRRGVVQAARHYFGRSLATLNTKEMLALATMVRAPSLLDPIRGKGNLEKRIEVLAERMVREGNLTFEAYKEATDGQLLLHTSTLTAAAHHFLTYVKERMNGTAMPSHPLRTTLDGELQQKVQGLLEQRLRDISEYGLKNGGVLIIDHTSGEVLTWAVAGKIDKNDTGYDHDAVRTARQPGSTLKPFVYALALDRGWTAATAIKDEPITEAVEHGLHIYRNFSQVYYGEVSLAEALGNSLNTPAIRTLNFVGLTNYLKTLRNLGMTSLTKGMETYGNGLVLGNAEISLLELVQAYSALAQGGIPMTLSVLLDENTAQESGNQRIFSEQAAKTIGMILSEDSYRQLEFGKQSVLTFPERTAVKTGTSAKANDVWTVAYNGRYLVGIWFGNMDRSPPKKQVTGAGGPALLARSVFSEVTKRYGYCPMPKVGLGLAWQESNLPSAREAIRMIIPSEDMEILFDPRIPDNSQVIPFTLSGVTQDDQVEWDIDNQNYLSPVHGKLLWPVTLGEHTVSAKVKSGDGRLISLPARKLTVK